MQMFENCLPDIESILPRLAQIIDADYTQGQFGAFEDLFVKSGIDEDHWFLSSNSGIEVKVRLEKYEGSFFISINGEGIAFTEATEYLA